MSQQQAPSQQQQLPTLFDCVGSTELLQSSTPVSPMQQCYGGPFQQMPSFGGYHDHGSSNKLKHVNYKDTEVDPDATLVAVIVTIMNGSSYDELFTTVPQLAGEGQRVAVYQAPYDELAAISSLLDEGAPAEEGSVLAQLGADLAAVEPAAVVFNWECCSFCSDAGFGDKSQTTLELIERVIARGSMVMASDFALKALIKDWQVDLLGPNPFVKIGEFDSSFTLKFDTQTLKECSSAQLQKVGELCAEGTADSHALGGTIAYTVDKTKSDATSAYQLEVLTVATNMSGVNLEKLDEKLKCNVRGEEGAAGHVILTYPTGGQLLASCGHWIELSKLDVSLDDLFKAAEAQYGGAYVANMRAEMEEKCFDDQSRRAYASVQSAQMIQQSAPCMYSKQ